jgi:predicted MFS family arabinose efflux permease
LTNRCTALAAIRLPDTSASNPPALSKQWAALHSRELWGAYITSGLIIGATFAAFSYCTPILIEVVGIEPAHVAPLLALYGVANLLGNMIVGRLADRYTLATLGWGLGVMVVALSGFALAGHQLWLSLACFLALGLTGVSYRPPVCVSALGGWLWPPQSIERLAGSRHRRVLALPQRFHVLHPTPPGPIAAMPVVP